MQENFIFSLGFPADIVNFKSKDSIEAKDENKVIRITWNDRVEAFECKSDESSKLSMVALACRSELECSLVKYCFDGVSN